MKLTKKALKAIQASDKAIRQAVPGPLPIPVGLVAAMCEGAATAWVEREAAAVWQDQESVEREACAA